jgi:PAS domain S-box-containing protein
MPLARDRFSIAGVVIVALVTAATVLLAGMGYAGYRFFAERQRDEFRQRHVILANQLGASLSLPLWNFDRDQIAKVVESAMQDRDVFRVVVRSGSDRAPVAQRSRDGDWSVVTGDGVAPVGLLREHRAIATAGDHIGEVDVFTTPQFLDHQLRRASISILGAIGVIDLILIVGLYLLLWRTVLAPLRAVEQHAHAVSSGTPQAPLPAAGFLGELDSLRDSIARMVAMLESRYAALSKSEARYRGLAEDLRESEEKFSKAFRSSPDAMTISELETARFIEVNDGFERLFGFPRHEVLGRTAFDLGLWQPASVREEFVRRLRNGGAVRDLEVQSVNRRGTLLTCLLSAESMEVGGQLCLVTIVHDITDRKQAEAERLRALAREREAREEFTRRLLAGQEAERRRIAGELHDSLGQNLLLVKNRAQLAITGSTPSPEVRAQFENIQNLVTDAIAEVRQISHDLRPYQLDQLGLTRALEAMLEAAARNSGLVIERRLDLVDELFVGENATHLYRIAQESISNILKHAGAKSARVLLERDLHAVRLWIEDNGCGFPPGGGSDDPRAGLGLRNIAERTRIIGGSLLVDSTSGGGTRIEVMIPIRESV